MYLLQDQVVLLKINQDLNNFQVFMLQILEIMNMKLQIKIKQINKVYFLKNKEIFYNKNKIKMSNYINYINNFMTRI